jgi:hypothetical protein
MNEIAKKEERLYTLKLHESIRLGDKYTVLRVPGGWIYYDRNGKSDENGRALTSTAVFVPFDSEFKTNVEFVGRKTTSRYDR